jgi:uncharacterized membrane protein YedE/YeeE
MKTVLAAAGAGALFALGLTVSGMTLPARVLGFLDVTGQWDPALALVMAGALAVYAPLYRLITRRQHPWLAAGFDIPGARQLDRRLLLGAAVFGVGWGVAGMCPGPAIVTLGALAPEGWVFAGGMVLGALLYQLFDGLVRRRQGRREPPELAAARP